MTKPDTPELLAVSANIRSIPVTDTVAVARDPGDSWFAVGDSDNWHYDALGVVIMSMDDLDALIVALGQLRK